MSGVRGAVERPVQGRLGSAETLPEHDRYRPALDGLRALAFLSVIAYHFGCTWVPGGFLGVDTFVVLSGYLITSLLIREFADTHRVKVVTFWARRVRRRFRPSFCCLLRLARGPIG